jgi:hypothetical protein
VIHTIVTIIIIIIIIIRKNTDDRATVNPYLFFSILLDGRLRNGNRVGFIRCVVTLMHEHSGAAEHAGVETGTVQTFNVYVNCILICFRLICSVPARGVLGPAPPGGRLCGQTAYRYFAGPKRNADMRRVGGSR